MDIQSTLRELSDRLGASASVKTVFGDPVTCGDRTVVPVAKVFYSFGGGAGRRHGEQEGGPGGAGGGAGGTVAAWPSGALEVTPQGTRFVGVHDGKLLAISAAVGFVLGLGAAVAFSAGSAVCRVGRRSGGNE